MNPFLLFPRGRQRQPFAGLRCRWFEGKKKREEGRKGKVDSKKFSLCLSISLNLRSSFFFSECTIICHHQWKASMKKKWIGQCYLVCSAKRRIADGFKPRSRGLFLLSQKNKVARVVSRSESHQTRSRGL